MKRVILLAATAAAGAVVVRRRLRSQGSERALWATLTDLPPGGEDTEPIEPAGQRPSPTHDPVTD